MLIFKRIVLFLIFIAMTVNVSFSQSNSYRKECYKYFDLFLEYEYEDTLKARIYSDSAVFFAKKSKNDGFLGDAYRLQGWYYHDRSRFDDAIESYSKSLSAMKRANDLQGIADAYGNLGNAYYDQRDLSKSLEMQLMSLKINEQIIRTTKDKKELAAASESRSTAIHNTGNIYGEIEMFDEAFKYAFESMTYDMKTKDTVGVAISCNMIASLYKQTNKVDSAEYYFKKAISIFKKKHQPFEYANALIEYATLEDANLTKAQRSTMAKKAIQIRRDMADTGSEASSLIKIGSYFFDDLKMDSLGVLMKRAFFIIDSEGLADLEQDYFKLYARYHARGGKFKEAFFALEDYLKRKAIADERKHKQDLIAGGIKYQLESKYYQETLLQQNKFTKERNQYLEDISEIQNTVYLSVIGFIILITSLLYYVGSNRRRKRLNSILIEKNTIVQEQKGIVDRKNKSISDSINYARRLQTAILPTPAQINAYLPDSFLMFLPKDVVSGDFYWFETKGDWCFLAVADCTGHGVPGALVSVVCSNALNQSVNEFGKIQPGEILDKTRELVVETFAKSGEQVSDGMDICLIAVHLKERRVLFSGAHNGLWIIREKVHCTEIPDSVRTAESEKHVLLEWKGDKQPIGNFHVMADFKQYEIQLQPNDQLYLMSDGFADQFGGPDGKKFKYIPLKNLLLENCERDIDTQKSILLQTFNEWSKGHEQIDDVCIIGLRC